ncbi:MAG: DUF3791 domain-containing protein [Bacteroidales bacterium]|nr:DUF3791 domain-containing protein [Bacteroidales bacterium]
MQNIEESIVPLKIAELVEVIVRKKQMSAKDALCYLYNSNFYSKLYDSKAKWWYLPVEELYIELEKTKKQEKIDFTSRELLFVIFCIERYSIKQGKNPLEVYSLFERKDVIGYLKGNFEILHTQGEEYILEEIDLYFKKRKNS